jgi:glycosyltransferase involved in cell wall biosynthesis
VPVVASIVIPARDAAATIGATLAALAAQEDAPAHEVIVVDDGSRDHTRDVVAAAPLPVRLLTTRGGEGPGAARNVGASAAEAALLVFTDADCEPEPTWLARLVGAAETADLVQGAVLPPPDAQIGPFDRVVYVGSEYGLYQTANLALRRSYFERAGRFQPVAMPRRGKELGEDAWLAWRARRLGARSVFAPDAVVRHLVFPRDARGYVTEQARVVWFPELVRHMPELRDTFLWRRWFLGERTAGVDLAVTAVATAIATRRLFPLVGVLPYARTAWRDTGSWAGRRRAEVAAAHITADAVRLGALAWGSLRSRCLVL